MGKTSIEWTQVTWNPTVGCDRISGVKAGLDQLQDLERLRVLRSDLLPSEEGLVSPGCAHCYAKELHDRRPLRTRTLGAEVQDRNDAGFEGDTPASWPMDTDYQETVVGHQGDPVRVRLRDRKGGRHGGVARGPARAGDAGAGGA